MEAVILAGGFGTRLRSVISDVPKPMAPVAGRPFLEVLLSALSRKGITRAILSVGYMAEKIQAHFGYRYECIDLDYAVESEPLGTGGALKLALGKCRAGAVLVLNGDTFLNVDLAPLVASKSETGAHAVVVAREVQDTSRYGRLSIVDGFITSFAEKDVSGPGLINAGAYLVDRNLLSHMPVETRFSLEADYFQHEVKRSRIPVVVCRELFIDIGVPEDYMRAQTVLRQYA